MSASDDEVGRGFLPADYVPTKRYEIVEKVYEFMFSEVQELRDAVVKLVLPAAGGLLGFAVWGLSTELEAGGRQRGLISVGVVIFGAVAFGMVSMLRRYFTGVAQVVKRIDRLLGLHTKGSLGSAESIFPEEWQDFGTQRWREPVFLLAHAAVVMCTAFAVYAVWVAPPKRDDRPERDRLEARWLEIREADQAFRKDLLTALAGARAACSGPPAPPSAPAQGPKRSP